MTCPSPADRCPSAVAWCWVQPADALTGAVVRCCERPYAFVKWTGGRVEKREWYWMCNGQEQTIRTRLAEMGR